MSKRTAEEIQEFLNSYNWDDGVEEIAFLLDEPNCEFGNALLFYWLLEGPFYYVRRYTEHTFKDLLLKLEDRLLNGFYQKRNVRYYPVTEERLFKTQVYLIKKEGLPIELIEPDYS
jgi:hypothetical protein